MNKHVLIHVARHILAMFFCAYENWSPPHYSRSGDTLILSSCPFWGGLSHMPQRLAEPLTIYFSSLFGSAWTIETLREWLIARDKLRTNTFLWRSKCSLITQVESLDSSFLSFNFSICVPSSSLPAFSRPFSVRPNTLLLVQLLWPRQEQLLKLRAQQAISQEKPSTDLSLFGLKTPIMIWLLAIVSYVTVWTVYHWLLSQLCLDRQPRNYIDELPRYHSPISTKLCRSRWWLYQWCY